MRTARARTVVAAACLFLAACGSDPANESLPANEPTTPATEPATRIEEVRMTDLAFTPASATVPIGSTVRWVNDDTVPHTVTFAADGVQSSEVIEPGGTFQTSFGEPGGYAYTCTLHPGMEGVVEVVDAEAATEADPLAAADEASSHADPGHTAMSDAHVEFAQLPGAGGPGVDIVLGEWALVPSSREAPPGPITFRFRNQGTVAHALRIRTSGSGKNRFEWRAEAVAPGESAVLVADLAPGTYEIDCPIEDAHGEHDALGMEMIFTVHEGALALASLPDSPVTGSEPRREAASGASVSITGFAFQPAEMTVPVGSTVAWHNGDPTPHTVTGDGFDTGVIDRGATGMVSFDVAGSYDYVCAIHPSMRGRVVVSP